MNELYLEVLPQKYLWLGGGSGSSGGGGTTTTNNTTTNKMLSWGEYVPNVTSSAYNKLVPQLEAKANIGLTPQERAYYTGQGMTQLANTQAGAQKALSGNLARSGARGGAVTEAYGDLARSAVMGGAGMASNLMGQDISQKGSNTDRLMKAIALPNAPVITGTTGTQTTNYAPGKSSGGGMS
jgi:hypothetical protein